MILKTIKLSGKGQIAIPLDIRQDAKIKEGDRLLIIEKDGKIMIEKTCIITEHLQDNFKDLLKHSEKVAEKLWGNKADEIWDTV